MFNLKDMKDLIHKDGTSQASIKSRVATIRALGNTNTKKKHDNHEERFDKLLGYLKDESPECRIAAAETLGQCSREVAVTYLCQYIQTEQDENVVKAMKAAISSIRENIRRNR